MRHLRRRSANAEPMSSKFIVRKRALLENPAEDVACINLYLRPDLVYGQYEKMSDDSAPTH